MVDDGGAVVAPPGRHTQHLLGVLERIRGEQIEETDDCGERGAQLMAHRRDQIGLRLDQGLKALQLLHLLRDVLELTLKAYDGAGLIANGPSAVPHPDHPAIGTPEAKIGDEGSAVFRAWLSVTDPVRGRG